jgi:hypothetical protein
LLHLPHRLRDRLGGGQAEENMDVVLGPANGKSFHLVLARDSSEVGPQWFPRTLRDEFAALFCRKDAMKQRRAIGMGHVRQNPTST